jgi:hypothetical protein
MDFFFAGPKSGLSHHNFVNILVWRLIFIAGFNGSHSLQSCAKNQPLNLNIFNDKVMMILAIMSKKNPFGVFHPACLMCVPDLDIFGSDFGCDEGRTIATWLQPDCFFSPTYSG